MFFGKEESNNFFKIQKYEKQNTTTLIIKLYRSHLEANLFRYITYVQNVWKVWQAITIIAVHSMFIQEFLLTTLLLSVADLAWLPAYLLWSGIFPSCLGFCHVSVKQSLIISDLQGLYRIGKHDVPVYDGSWTEWEAQSDSDYPKATATAA